MRVQPLKIQTPIAIVLAICLLALGPVSAKDNSPAQCPEAPSSVPRGLTVRTSLGPALWVGEMGPDVALGMALTFGAGWEFFDWLALEAVFSAGYHNTDQAQPPAPGTFSTLALHAAVRFNLPLDPFDLFLLGGFGFQQSQPDILVRVDSFDTDNHMSWLGGLGFVWHTPRRRFWIGMQANAMGGIEFPGILVRVSGLIGCTLF